MLRLSYRWRNKLIDVNGNKVARCWNHFTTQSPHSNRVPVATYLDLFNSTSEFRGPQGAPSIVLVGFLTVRHWFFCSSALYLRGRLVIETWKVYVRIVITSAKCSCLKELELVNQSLLWVIDDFDESLKLCEAICPHFATCKYGTNPLCYAWPDMHWPVFYFFAYLHALLCWKPILRFVWKRKSSVSTMEDSYVWSFFTF